jgi:threonine dehydrogenase-like Zn-dependent dehydrogenase
VVVTDVMSQRREAALAMGAEAALDPGAGDWQQDLVPLVGAREVDVAFDAVGITPTFEQALHAVRLGGTVVAIGGWRTVPLDLSYLVTHEVHLVGTFNYTPAEFDEARLCVQDGRFDTRPLAVNVRPMAEGVAVFENLVRNPGGAIKTVLVPPEAN